ncbi:DUF3616 domain-containing protein [Pseudanabaena sp. PCC 6802]|uniref:DUF3616 domain-containing protein n=1 Tax=Pseudanabaena sp. PCC 6802 TaxID=118173 RepID=UPI00034625D8|nr:DUF3616 domain-containing protein [Pseudanabaena sp. PCC 6802]
MQDISLHFNIYNNPKDSDGKVKEIRDSLSAVASIGKNLFLASDETTTVERLKLGAEGRTFSQHQQFQINRYVKLPDSQAEIDIEGMDYDGNYLWIVGSHSLQRDRPKAKQSMAENIESLTYVLPRRKIANRHFLARIPLVERDGEYELVSDGDLTAAQLEISGSSNDLIEALGADKHLKPFLKIPGKDNGFDIEGLAVRDRRIFLGLRGPVLRGWAIVLELEVKVKGNKLKLGKIGSHKRLYKKHFLQLNGLGIRDLAIADRDLLILAGPTMSLDGAVQLFRWRNALDDTEAPEQPQETLIWQAPDKLFPIQDIPYGKGSDRAEGMTIFSGVDGKRSLLVVYDALGASRRWGDAIARADLFDLGD